MTCSQKVNNDVKEEIISILGILIVNCHDKYLGIPAMIGRSKKRTFAMVEERIWETQKLEGKIIVIVW